MSNFDQSERLNVQASVWAEQIAISVEQENFSEAIKLCNEAIINFPDSHEFYYNKGIALFNMQNFQDALDCFNKAVELEPNDASVWNNKGIVLLNMGNDDDGIDCLKKAARMGYSEAVQNCNQLGIVF